MDFKGNCYFFWITLYIFYLSSNDFLCFACFYLTSCILIDIFIIGNEVQGPVFTCPNCSRNYQHHKTLKRHMDYECGIEPQFPCPVCPKRLKQKAHLLNHAKRLHGLDLKQWMLNSQWFQRISWQATCSWEVITIGKVKTESHKKES